MLGQGGLHRRARRTGREGGEPGYRVEPHRARPSVRGPERGPGTGSDTTLTPPVTEVPPPHGMTRTPRGPTVGEDRAPPRERSVGRQTASGSAGTRPLRSRITSSKPCPRAVGEPVAWVGADLPAQPRQRARRQVGRSRDIRRGAADRRAPHAAGATRSAGATAGRTLPRIPSRRSVELRSACHVSIFPSAPPPASAPASASASAPDNLARPPRPQRAFGRPLPATTRSTSASSRRTPSTNTFGGGSRLTTR